jgi:hypothetical protein
LAAIQPEWTTAKSTMPTQPRRSLQIDFKPVFVANNQSGQRRVNLKLMCSFMSVLLVQLVPKQIHGNLFIAYAWEGWEWHSE